METSGGGISQKYPVSPAKQVLQEPNHRWVSPSPTLSPAFAHQGIKPHSHPFLLSFSIWKSLTIHLEWPQACLALGTPNLRAIIFITLTQEALKSGRRSCCRELFLLADTAPLT